MRRLLNLDDSLASVTYPATTATLDVTTLSNFLTETAARRIHVVTGLRILTLSRQRSTGLEQLCQFNPINESLVISAQAERSTASRFTKSFTESRLT